MLDGFKISLTIEARTVEELEANMRTLRVALAQRMCDFQDKVIEAMAAEDTELEKAYREREAFLESVWNQMSEQEKKWLDHAKRLIKA